MTKDELLHRLQDIEWEDFECKEAKSDLPKSVWETVSGQKGGQKSNQKSNQKNQDRMLKLLMSEPTLSRKDLSTILGISQSTVQNYIRLFRQQGRLIRIGGAKGGSWKVVKMK